MPDHYFVQHSLPTLFPTAAMVYASRVDRFLGQVIDGLITCIPLAAAAVIGMFFASLTAVLFVVGGVIALAYYFACDGIEGDGRLVR
jgi:hypothetical protein